MDIFLVGGAVRDSLLNLPIKDRDWVVIGATPQQLLDKGYIQVGADFPVFLHPETKEEHALARTERKSGSGYQGFICDFSPDITLEEDLQRRDLTINAIAQDQYGNLVDPYNGQKDIADKQLRHVSEAFSEDPLRVLRVARFAARFAGLGFSVAPETMQLMRTLADSGELEHLTEERVWQETVRALGEPHPRVYFEVLRECGALKVLFAEIDRLFGVPQSPVHHPEIDCGIHTLMTLEQAARLSDKPVVRWATLLHDLGKAQTDASELPHHPGHEAGGESEVKSLNERLKTPNEFRALSRLSCLYHTKVHKALQLNAQEILSFFDAIDLWRKPERLEDLLLTCMADSRGRTGYENIDYPQADYIRKQAENVQKITAQSFVAQGIKGKAIGEAMRKARLETLKDGLISPE